MSQATTAAAQAESTTALTPAQLLGPLYRGTFLFGIACGISIALTPLFLNEEGYSKSEIGNLGLIFAAGLVLFALPVGALLRRFGGKRMLVATLLGYAVCVAAFPFMKSFSQIGALRFFDGMFSIGVWVSSETIVLSRADKKHKGHLTSLYAIWLASGYVVGPVLATGLARFISMQELFLLAGALAILSSIYLTWKLSESDAPAEAPDLANESEEVEPEAAGAASAASAASAAGADEAPSAASTLSPLAVLNQIKNSCFAAFSYGYFQASVVLFLPLYLMESKGIAKNDTIILPGLFCFGMLLFSNIAGRLGDKRGHLNVVSSLSFLGLLCVLGFVFVDNYLLMCTLVFLAGATFASMSPVALALIGVVVARKDLSRANSFYNTFYAGGMLVGPPLSSLLFESYGGPAMLYHLALLWAAFVSFSLVFRRDDPANSRLAESPL